MQKKALIVIDYTFDFVADEGKLTCGERGQRIEKRIVELTKEFLSNGDFVVMAVDGHIEGEEFHPETNLYPPHNIIGTSGRDLYGELNTVYQENKDKIYWMDKTRYSAFAGTDLEIKLRERGITEVHLCGLVTDICLLHSAVDTYNKGLTGVVHKDAVDSFNPAGHEWALGHFKNQLGFKVLEKGEEV